MTEARLVYDRDPPHRRAPSARWMPMLEIWFGSWKRLRPHGRRKRTKRSKDLEAAAQKGQRRGKIRRPWTRRHRHKSTRSQQWPVLENNGGGHQARPVLSHYFGYPGTHRHIEEQQGGRGCPDGEGQEGRGLPNQSGEKQAFLFLEGRTLVSGGK